MNIAKDLTGNDRRFSYFDDVLTIFNKLVIYVHLNISAKLFNLD